MNLTNEFIKKLKESTDFQVFLEYIAEIYDDLDTISDLDLRRKNETLGETSRARKVAREALYKIMLPFIDFNEKKEPSEKQKETARKKFGL